MRGLLAERIFAHVRQEKGQALERIEFNGQLFAIIVRDHFEEPGIHFFTPNDCSQQLAYMKHPRGKGIQPHVHNRVERHIDTTQEVLFVKKGKLRVDFYDSERMYLESRILGAGDTIFLASAGHGFEVLEEVQMFEVKQGPYIGEAEKTRFQPSLPSELRIK